MYSTGSGWRLSRLPVATAGVGMYVVGVVVMHRDGRLSRLPVATAGVGGNGREKVCRNGRDRESGGRAGVCGWKWCTRVEDCLVIALGLILVSPRADSR